MKRITIIVPIYNEEEVLPQLIKRLDQMSSRLKNIECEFLFVNDGSDDQTLEKIKEFSMKDDRVSFIDLSRNFGKELAMLAGFDHADGDAVVVIDGDLQQPPEIILEMVDWWKKGYDDVYAVRTERNGESELKNWTSKSYYKIIQKITTEKVYPLAGDFRLLDRKCVKALRALRETERYTKGMYGWIGFKKKRITYVADERAAGKTKWNFGTLLKLAIDGLTSYSTVPLKVWSYIGFIISFLAFLILIYEIGKTIFFGTDVAGYPTLLAGTLFLGGIQLISLGVIGEYLGRVFIETKRRPPYFIREDSLNQSHKSSEFENENKEEQV